jgi:lipoprotein-anchoring transpeptidase ErfK/SrfK
MIIASMLRRGALAAATVAAVAGLDTGPASAQLLWDWGGGSAIGGSGRENVRFNPQYGTGQIIVSFGDRRLYYVTRPGEAISYPIAIPREQSRWQGTTSVSQKRVNPSWTPTPAMIAENPRLPRWVPGGHPMNPLGNRALYLGSSMYRIHGTDAPWTIGTAVSKGCIRMYNQDVADLFPRAHVGAKVTVTYQRFSTAAISGGSSTVSSGSSGGGGSFFLFGDDEKPRPKVVRQKTKSASVEKKAVPKQGTAPAGGAPSEQAAPPAMDRSAPAELSAMVD